VTSTFTLGAVHVSAPFCGFGLGFSYDVGYGTAAVEAGLSGSGEAADVEAGQEAAATAGEAAEEQLEAEGTAATRSLGTDPATGAFRQSEYETALRIEEARGVTLTRSADPSIDWVDQYGNTYDAVGNFSSKYFDQQWPNLQARILDHMDKADFVPVDVSGFTPEQIAQVQQFIEPLGPSVFIVGP